MFRILIIGAHPDDCEVYAGGAAALWRRRGDRVRFVSVTNGNAGHQSIPAGELAARRRGEAEAAARVIGAEHEVLDNDDGALEPTLRARGELIRLVRRFEPDLILTHRPNDYHPDHRYTSVLVQDSAFLVTVPKVCPDTPHLERNPVIAYLQDDFRKPCPFSPDVAVDVDSVMDLKWAMIDAHASQFYEWVPYNEGCLEEVPPPGPARLEWLRRRWSPRFEAATHGARTKLVETYGTDGGGGVRFAEAFEVCEYGMRPSAEEIARLFPR